MAATADVAEFLDTLQRIAKGGSVVDPALVQDLVTARRRDDRFAVLSVREHEVLALMAEGRSNAGIAHRLWVTEGTVEKHVRAILTKLNLPETGDDHRRVLDVITFLEPTDRRRTGHTETGLLLLAGRLLLAGIPPLGLAGGWSGCSR
jgi:DNA-binding NarL/FixJ family response regulator